MKMQNFEQATHYAQSRLERELSPNLIYHGIVHTRDEVIPAIDMLAGMEGIQEEAYGLLKTAAWFHDLGFVEQASSHEMIGIAIAQKILPTFGYTPDQIGIVCAAILATIIPQSATTLLEQLMADADLNIFGRKNFLQRNNDLRRELANLGKIYSDLDWYTSQLAFMERHTFFTKSAHALFDEQKRVNMADMRKAVATLTSGE